MTSEAADLAIKEALEITEQPESVEAAKGARVSFHVAANRADVTYQWQYNKDGETWNNCTSAGYNTDTFSFTMGSTMGGRQYRCVVTSGDEQVTSDAAELTLKVALKITEQPLSVEAARGEKVTFHVAANKTDVTYQWQYNKDGATSDFPCGGEQDRRDIPVAVQQGRSDVEQLYVQGIQQGDVQLHDR